MASMRNKIADCLMAAGIVGLGAGAVVGVAGLGILAVIGMFAAVTSIQALILWAAWNWTAPLFDFIPVAYQHLGFLNVWGFVAIVRIVGRILFGTAKSSK